MNWNWKYIVSLVFVVLVTIFIVQNSAPVELNFFFASFSISLALVLLISILIGALIVIFANFLSKKH